MTFFWFFLTGLCIYLAGFLTASIMASGKMQDLELENDQLRLRSDNWLENPTWGEP